MKTRIKLHSLHAKGRYYVDVNTCLCTTACEFEAPEHFAIDKNALTAYVYRQPETPEEDAACRSAMNCCPYEAISDDSE